MYYYFSVCGRGAPTVCTNIQCPPNQFLPLYIPRSTICRSSGQSLCPPTQSTERSHTTNLPLAPTTYLSDHQLTTNLPPMYPSDAEDTLPIDTPCSASPLPLRNTFTEKALLSAEINKSNLLSIEAVLTKYANLLQALGHRFSNSSPVCETGKGSNVWGGHNEKMHTRRHERGTRVAVC